MVVKHVLFRSTSGPLKTSQPFEDVAVCPPTAKSYTFGSLEHQTNLPPEIQPDTLEDLGILEISPSSGSKPELLSLIVSALDACVERQELEEQLLATSMDSGLKNAPNRLTTFHGSRPPPISIPAYLCRIAKYTKCSPVCFVMCLMYLDNLSVKDMDYLPSCLSVHRLVLTGVMLAAKFADDHYFNNAFFARVGGVPVADLNRMEMEMLRLLNFRLLCPAEGLRAAVKRLQRGAFVIGSGESLSARSGLLQPSFGRKRRSNSGNGAVERRTHRRSSIDSNSNGGGVSCTTSASMSASASVSAHSREMQTQSQSEPASVSRQQSMSVSYPAEQPAQ